MINKNLIFLWFFLLPFCVQKSQAQLFYKSGTFKVLNAVKSTMYPGVQGSPISTTLSFTITMRKCSKSFAIDSFWLDGFADKVQIQYANGNDFDNKACPGDTLLVRCVYYRYNDENVNPNGPKFSGSKEAKPPKKHKGKALFRYILAGKKYYFSIQDIKNGGNVYAP